jgi:peptide/nickel transport system substrate-binding protein
MRRKFPLVLFAALALAALSLAVIACSSAEDEPTRVPQQQAQTAPQATQAPAAQAAPRATAMPSAPVAAPTPVPAYRQPTATPPSAMMAKIDRGGILSHAVHETFASFDLHWEGSYIAVQPLAPIYNGLLTRDIRAAGDDPVGQLAPDLAESWEATDGGRTYVFNLRQDATWNDGTEFSCEDVDATFTRWYDSNVSNRSATFPTMREDWDCTDEDTFVVNFDVAQGAFLTALGSARFEMMQKETIAKVEKFRTGLAKEPGFLVGTGPYEVDSWTPGVDFVSKRRMDYWKQGEDGGTLPYLDGYQSVVITDLSAMFAAFRGQRLTMGGIARHLEKSEADIIESRPDLKSRIAILVGPRNAWHNIVFNLANAPTDDLRVRQAFFYAIDQRATRQAAVEGWGSLGSHIGPHLPFAIPEAELLADPRFSEDMEARRAKAKELLTEAGFADGLQLELIQRRGPLYNRGAIANQADLKKAGIDISIRLVDTATIGDVSRSGEFNIYTSPGSTLLDDPDGYWDRWLSTQSDVVNYSRYKSAKFDELFAKQSREIDIAKRIEIAREIDRLLLEDAVEQRSYYWFQSMSHWNNLQGWHMNFGDNVYNFGRWEEVWCRTGNCNDGSGG